MQIWHRWSAIGATLIVALALAVIVPGAYAQQTDVTIANFTFAPSTLSVPAGSTVTWTNTDGVVHTVTANDGSFDSGGLAEGDTFQMEFDAPGTYGYYCVPHGAPGSGMFGTIVVTDSGG